MDAVRASYVYRTALSAAVDMIRRRRARVQVPLDSAEGRFAEVEATAVAPNGPVAVETEELAARVDAAVAGLAEPRDVVVRLYLSGYSHDEIAELLAWTEGKTRNLLYRGLADLRARLADLGIGPRRVA
jgi:RNA polymerase sigma factor (sigma-70 family)